MLVPLIPLINAALAAALIFLPVDAAGNVTSETDALGNLSRTSYNTLKKVATQTDALNRVTRFDYDVRGYETRVTHADGRTQLKGYDPNGNLAANRAGRVSANAYDALDRLARVTYADGRFVENGYDAAGRLTSVKDAQRQRLAVLKVFFRWAVRARHALYNPASELEIPARPPRLPHTVLTLDEVERLLATPDVATPSRPEVPVVDGSMAAISRCDIIGAQCEESSRSASSAAGCARLSSPTTTCARQSPRWSEG
ncbi:MAG: hypothetical protein ACREVG_18290 [Burkholderiales bacterium]